MASLMQGHVASPTADAAGLLGLTRVASLMPGPVASHTADAAGLLGLTLGIL